MPVAVVFRREVQLRAYKLQYIHNLVYSEYESTVCHKFCQNREGSASSSKVRNPTATHLRPTVRTRREARRPPRRQAGARVLHLLPAPEPVHGLHVPAPLSPSAHSGSVGLGGVQSKHHAVNKQRRYQAARNDWHRPATLQRAPWLTHRRTPWVPLALLAQRQSAARRFGSQLVRAAPCDGTRGLGRGQLELHAYGLLPSEPTLQQGRLSNGSHRPAGLRVRARARLRVRASLNDGSHRLAGLRVRARARLKLRASLSNR